MKATAQIGLLATVVLVAGCYSGRGGFFFPVVAYTTVWDLELDGQVLDLSGAPVFDFGELAELVLTPSGPDRYRVDFRGVLPFLVLDANFGDTIRWYEFPLDFLDGQTGVYLPDPDFPGYGIFRFDGLAAFTLLDLGVTEVELFLDLYPHGSTLESSDFADLVWDAALYSGGSPLVPFPGEGRLYGQVTVAVRIE